MGCANHPTVNEGIVRCTRCHRQFCQDCVAYLRGFPYCAECKGEQVRDIQSGTTPGALDLASVWQRLGALLLDHLLVSCISTPIILVVFVGLGALGAATKAREEILGVLVWLAILPLTIVLPLVYEAWMLQARGQTLGKMALGIKVVTPEGAQISAGQAWGRTGMRLVFGVFCAAFVDYIPALLTPEKTCIHDMLAKTRVVRLRG